jgi:hypothetical protein
MSRSDFKALLILNLPADMVASVDLNPVFTGFNNSRTLSDAARPVVGGSGGKAVLQTNMNQLRKMSAVHGQMELFEQLQDRVKKEEEERKRAGKPGLEAGKTMDFLYFDKDGNMVVDKKTDEFDAMYKNIDMQTNHARVLASHDEMIAHLAHENLVEADRQYEKGAGGNPSTGTDHTAGSGGIGGLMKHRQATGKKAPVSAEHFLQNYAHVRCYRIHLNKVASLASKG